MPYAFPGVSRNNDDDDDILEWKQVQHKSTSAVDQVCYLNLIAPDGC